MEIALEEIQKILNSYENGELLEQNQSRKLTQIVEIYEKLYMCKFCKMVIPRPLVCDNCNEVISCTIWKNIHSKKSYKCCDIFLCEKCYENHSEKHKESDSCLIN